MDAPHTPQPPHFALAVRALDVHPADDDGPASLRVTLQFTCAAGEPQETTAYPRLASGLLATFPELRRHRCDNGSHRSFSRELADTQLAHAYEHVLVELLALERGTRHGIGGETGWNFAVDGPGVYRVRVWGFTNEAQMERLVVAARTRIEDFL